MHYWSNMLYGTNSLIKILLKQKLETNAAY